MDLVRREEMIKYDIAMLFSSHAISFLSFRKTQFGRRHASDTKGNFYNVWVNDALGVHSDDCISISARVLPQLASMDSNLVN
jgi:hypothetical protein